MIRINAEGNIIKKNNHNRPIINQFTKQATPFAELKVHNNESEFQLM
jgi:hypothetical protein